MAVDQAGQDRQAGGIDDFRPGRQAQLAVATDLLEAARFDDDGDVFDRWTAGAVDQRSTLYDEAFGYLIFYLFNDEPFREP